MKSSLKYLAVFLVLAFVAASCQPAATVTPPTAESAPQPTAPTAVPAPTQKPLVKVTVQLAWVVQGEFHGIFDALENGFYKDEGLDVEVVAGGPDIRPIQMVATGAAQFGIGQPSGVIAARSNGVPVVTVIQHMQDSVVVYVAKKANGINTIEDLKGKTFGVWYGGSEYEPMLMVQKAGLAENDVNWAAQKFSMIEFYENKMDVASAAVWNELHLVLDAGYSPSDLTIFKAADHGASMIGDSIYTSEDMIKTKPEVVQAFVNATIRGWKWGIMHPEEAAAIVLKMNPSLDARQQLIQVEEVNRIVLARSGREFGLGYANLDDYNVSQDGLLLIKAISAPIDLTKAFDNSFWEKVPTEYKSVDDLDLPAIDARIKKTVGDW